MISIPAKTAIDCLDRPALPAAPPKWSAFSMPRCASAQQLVDMAVQVESTALLQRPGFVADLVAGGTGRRSCVFTFDR
jgi:hypothetical protein